MRCSVNHKKILIKSFDATKLISKIFDLIDTLFVFMIKVNEASCILKFICWRAQNPKEVNCDTAIKTVRDQPKQHCHWLVYNAPKQSLLL